MASDTFTDTNGTLLSAHTSEGSAWANVGGTTYAVANYKINASGKAEATGAWVYAGARNTNSTVDLSQIVFVGGITSIHRRLCVRSGASTLGYGVYFSSNDGTNFTQATVIKNGSFNAYLTISGSLAPIASDNTVKITATGTSTVTIEVFVNGTSIGTATDSSSPIGTGNPGFTWNGDSGGAAANSLFDNWTDGVSASGPSIPILQSLQRRRRL